MMLKPAVLVASFSRALLAAVQDELGRRGYVVATAEGGLDCLAQMRKLSPEIVVLDLSLPWGGGDGVLAQMREEPGIARTPIVLLTEDGSAGSLPDDLLSPVVTSLKKPVNLDVLAAVVNCSWPHPAPNGATQEHPQPGDWSYSVVQR